jgi:hypothetical protein
MKIAAAFAAEANRSTFIKFSSTVQAGKAHAADLRLARAAAIATVSSFGASVTLPRRSSTVSSSDSGFAAVADCSISAT